MSEAAGPSGRCAACRIVSQRGFGERRKNIGGDLPRQPLLSQPSHEREWSVAVEQSRAGGECDGRQRIVGGCRPPSAAPVDREWDQSLPVEHIYPGKPGSTF
jgi:hypothetical protein